MLFFYCIIWKNTKLQLVLVNFQNRICNHSQQYLGYILLQEYCIRLDQ